MSFSTCIILLILIVYIIFALRRFLFNVTSGCCGTAVKKEKKIKKSHYSYHYQVKIDDIHCQNCCNRIENEINHHDEYFAKVDLKSKILKLDSTQDLSQNEIINLIEHIGYHQIQFV